MTSFDVVTDTLMSASSTIAGVAGVVASANSSAASASGQDGSFAGEPIGEAFSAMCSRARSTTEELERTLRSLAHCVESAAEGYLVTDQGIVAASAVPGAVGSGSAPSSPAGGAR